jgi:hypothetical protein
MTWHAELSHKENIQWRAQLHCHFKGYWNTTTRQGQNQHVIAISVALSMAARCFPASVRLR